jgi:hypothetical protein
LYLILNSLNKNNLEWILDSDFDFPFTNDDNSISSFKTFMETLNSFFNLFENIMNHHIDQISPFLYHKNFQEQIRKRESLSIFELIILYSEILIFHQDKIIEFLFQSFNTKPHNPTSKHLITIGKELQVLEEEF